MRADRLLSIILLLQRHQHLTAKALATRLGVTERTIYRDIDALSLAGIPIYTRTGPDGGCFLDEGYRHSLHWFTGTELQTLLYAGSATPLSELGMQATMDNAVLKLLTLLPTRHQKDAHIMQQRLYLDPSGWYDTHEARQQLPLLKQAVWSDTLITATYESWDSQPQSRILAPYSLVHKAQRWYLVALNTATEQMRTYRIARLSDIHLQSTHFERDPDFDIATYWHETSANFRQSVPAYPVTLRVNAEGMTYFQQLFDGRYDTIEEDVDSVLIKVHYTVFEEARTSVLGIGTLVEIIAPEELKHAVIAHAQAIVEQYAE